MICWNLNLMKHTTKTAVIMYCSFQNDLNKELTWRFFNSKSFENFGFVLLNPKHEHRIGNHNSYWIHQPQEKEVFLMRWAQLLKRQLLLKTTKLSTILAVIRMGAYCHTVSDAANSSAPLPLDSSQRCTNYNLLSELSPYLNCI